MSRKLWYWKVEVSKVLADGGLSGCSLEARGAWMWLLMRMFSDGATGVWEGNMRQLALTVGCIGHDIDTIYREWVDAGIGDFEALDGGRVRITSRRMLAEAKARKADRARKASHSTDDSDSIPSHFRADSESMSVMSCHDYDYDSEELGEEGGVGGEEEQGDFAEAWDAYGKKVAKAAAERAWRRLNRGDRAAALARIPDYVAATPDVQYRANFATWLNGRRWEDEAPKNGAAPALSSPAACAGCGDALGVDFTRYQGRAYCDECYEARAWAKQEA